MSIFSKLFGRKREKPVTQQRNDSQIQFVDIRSKEEVALAQESAKGVGLPAGVDELVQLIKEAHCWGESNKYPGYSNYPQHERIRAIGQLIYSSGGHLAMQRAAYYVRKKNPLFGHSLESFWNGVGEWMA